MPFLNIFEKEKTLGINGKGEYNQQVSWFQGVDGPDFKICEVKKLSNWLRNSSTEILRKNKQLQYWPKNEVAYKTNLVYAKCGQKVLFRERDKKCLFSVCYFGQGQ